MSGFHGSGKLYGFEYHGVGRRFVSRFTKVSAAPFASFISSKPVCIYLLQMKLQANFTNVSPIVSQVNQEKPAKELKRKWMSESLFSEEDLKIFLVKGIEEAEILRQLGILHKGTVSLKLARAARVGDGIVQIAPDEVNTYVSLFNKVVEGGRVLKFVPASGAASRMFKNWHLYQEGKSISAGFAVTFCRDINKFAFYDDLKRVMALDGKDIQSYLQARRWADIIDFIITAKGLNYGWLPKALIKFHVYPEGSRTAMEEHLVEAAQYTRDARNICRIHFTVSEEHESCFQRLLLEVKSYYENLFGVTYEVGITKQLPSTETVALGIGNKPARDVGGKIMFRPGGHGALLANVNALDADIIFIKNIDNVAPDRLKDLTVLYKKILGGYLIRLRDEIFHNINLLLRGEVDDDMLSKIMCFCQKKLFLSFPNEFSSYSAFAKRDHILSRLNRPIRVCGVVKNEGEPGGGPFWVEGKDGTCSLQIVEKDEIDPNSEQQGNIWRSASHFNPVDLVCSSKNYQGEKFDLNLYADKGAVFISSKSYNGEEMKVLEHPGLWNGSMALWNTVFVEVPIETFNPVKIIEDLLRESHLPSD